MMSSEVFYSLTPYKKLMLTMETEMDYMIETASLQLDMLLEKKQLELKEAELTVLVEDGDIDMLSSLYTEAEESSQSGVLGSLHKICDSIIGFIKNTMKLIKEKFIDLFSKHDDFTVEDFEKSGIKGVAYNIDYQKKMRELGSKMTEGERLIIRIANTTGKSVGEIQGYCDSVKELVNNIPNIVAKAAKTGAAVGGVVILFKNWKSVAGVLSKGIDGIESTIQSVKSKLLGKNPEQEKKILLSMADLSKAYNKIASRVALGMTAVLHPKDTYSKMKEQDIRSAARKGKIGFATRKMGDLYSAGRSVKEKMSSAKK